MIEDLLREKIGLRPDSVGQAKIDADVRRRMEACGLADRAAYERLVRSSREELDKLISTVTVPETWFFRAYDSFIFLEEFIRGEWMQASLLQHGGRPLRILSLPCSTGEEPYSIAMTLLRCELAPSQFSIDAADINPSNLAGALKGVYSKNSFRGELQWFKSDYFKQEGNRYHISPKVKERVAFHCWNLLDLKPPEDESEQYDIVFCRNLIIYFDGPSQSKALDVLSSLVKENGLLFLGHAEATSLLFGRDFIPVSAKGSFAFKKAKPQAAPKLWDSTDTQRLLKVFKTGVANPSFVVAGAALPRERALPESAKSSAARSAAPLVVPAVQRKAVSQAPKPAQALGSDDLLAKAKSFADRGLLKEAAELCNVFIDKNKLNAEGYFLLGVVLLSLKRLQEAENLLNKAIFLNPGHSDALLRLAALKEGRGDKRGADLCRRRAGRAEGASNA